MIFSTYGMFLPDRGLISNNIFCLTNKVTIQTCDTNNSWWWQKEENDAVNLKSSQTEM